MGGHQDNNTNYATSISDELKHPMHNVMHFSCIKGCVSLILNISLIPRTQTDNRPNLPIQDEVRSRSALGGRGLCQA